MQRDLRTMPPGKWIHFGGLSPDTTPEEIAEFLYGRGIDVTPEHVSIKPYANKPGVSAMVSIPNEVWVMLLNWAIDGQTLNGRDVIAADFKVTAKKPV